MISVPRRRLTGGIDWRQGEIVAVRLARYRVGLPRFVTRGRGVDEPDGLLRRFLACKELKRLALAHEQAEHLSRRLIDDAERATALRAVIEQPITPGQVEQPPARFLQPVLDRCRLC